jgi:putative DNA primase/helicase
LPDGGTEPQTGPSPDFELVAWTGRDALVTFDANVKTNAKVRWAREAFRTELARRGASVSYVEIPPEDGTNGPDDFLAKHDDEAMLALLDGARRATEFDIPGRVPITEQSNAERLYAKYPDDFRYASDRGVWLAWNGRSWAVGDTCAVLRATSRVARDIYFEAANEPDEVRRKSLWKWAKDSESRRVQENAASLARSLGGFECAYAEIFDREPHLFNAANCTIDLRTGEPHPHRREDFLTKVAPIAYDADAECPKFSKFVAETFPARGLADYVSCVMGYFLGGVTSEQIWWLFHGGTATGKSTFVKILHGLLGPYAFALPENFFLISKGATDFTTAHLAGVRLATCSETSEGKRLDVAKLKMLTGEDAVTAALKYENQFTFRMEAKLVLVTNHAPRVPAGDDAIWRRIRVVPFRRPPVSDEARVADLAARLLETEGPGILRFAVRGSVERYRVGLAEPEVVKVAVRDYRADEDVIQHFLDDACVTDPATRVARKALYSAYARWSTENGLHAVSAKKLANELQRLGIDGDLGDRFWLGVRFKDSSTQEA